MYKVAIIGAGIGAQHLKGYQANPERFAVTHICDLDLERAEAVAAGTDARALSDFAAVLDAAPDLIDICLPPHLHFDFAQRALQAGAHVVCEKPLVASLSEADALAETSKATGKSVFPVFQYRYGLGMSQFHAVNEAGLLGKAFVATLETHWNRPASYYDVDWRGTWATERGGAILGHAIHIHDLICGLLGPAARIHAFLDTRVNAIEVEDCAAISMTMQSGALVTSSVTLGAADDSSRLRLIFEKATVESDHAPYAPAAGTWRFTARAPHEQSALEACVRSVGAPKSGFAGMMEAVADALDGDPRRAVSLGDGRASLDLVTALYHSARGGAVQDLPLQMDHPLYGGWLPD